MDKYFMWIHYERLHNHNKATHNKTVCIFLGVYCKIIFGWSVFIYRLRIYKRPFLIFFVLIWIPKCYRTEEMCLSQVAKLLPVVVLIKDIRVPLCDSDTSNTLVPCKRKKPNATRSHLLLFILTATHGGIDWFTEVEWRIYASVNYPSLVQIMACRLVGVKPFSEPILEYHANVRTCWIDMQRGPRRCIW